MWNYLLAVLGLVILCAAWVLFQRLLGRLDPEGQSMEERCAGCGSCTGDCDQPGQFSSRRDQFPK